MWVARTLVLGLAVFFNSLVGFSVGMQPFTLPGVSVTRVFYLNSEAYNGLYCWDISTGFEPLQGVVTFVVRGNIIIGRGICEVIYPIYDKEGHVIVIASGAHRRITNEQMREYGIFGTYFIAGPVSEGLHHFWLIEASEANISDLHYVTLEGHTMIPVPPSLPSVEAENNGIIIGWYANHLIHPIYNGREHLIVQDIGSGLNREITPIQGVHFGVFTHLPAEPQVNLSRSRSTGTQSTTERSYGWRERSRSPRGQQN